MIDGAGRRGTRHVPVTAGTARPVRRGSARRSLTTVVATAPIILFTLDPRGIVLLAQGGGLASLGLRPSEIVGRSVFDLLGNATGTRSAVRQALGGTASVTSIERAGLVYQASLTPELDPTGTVVAVTGVLSDASAVHRASEAVLRESGRRLARAQRVARLGSWDLDTVAGSVVWSDEMYRILGLSPGDVEPACDALLARVHPGDRARVEEAIRAAIEEGRPYSIDHRIVRLDGSEIVAHAQAEVTRDEDGRVVQVTSTVQDITDRWEAETELARLASAVEQAADSVIVTDTAGLITYVNPAFERISGYSRADVIGRTPALLKSGRHDRAFYSDMWATIVAGRTWTGTIVNRRKDGDLYEAAVTISPCTGPDGRITSYVEVARDVTHVRALEAQLRQAVKMEAVGRLAGGIAHDFNNLLTVINGYSGILLADIEPSDPRRESVEEIARAADRAAVLTRELLAFSRRQILQPRRVDLNAIIADTLAMLRLTVGEAIVLDVRPQRGVWTVFVDPEHLVQVILNLAINARDAMPSGGTLTIETRNLVTDAQLAATGLAGRRDEYVMLSVRDTGVGLSEEARAHLFEPFFTTKGKGKGTGLGLASVYGFVTQSKGYVAVDGAPGAGTRFDIYLPRVAGEPEPLEPAHPSAVRPAGPRTLLLVEDDPAVLAIGEMTLVREGYTVLTASSAEEALTISAGHRGRIDLLITDVVMPGLNGVDLAERL